MQNSKDTKGSAVKSHCAELNWVSPPQIHVYWKQCKQPYLEIGSLHK